MHTSGPSYGPLVKQCRVCGDVALGFNFNGLSCESCKAFFRRNAVKKKVFKCRKNGRCENQIDKFNRKYCKKCRLAKCYKIGMKKEMIMSFIKEQETLVHNGQLSIGNLENLSRDMSHLQTYDLERIKEVQQAMRIFANEKNYKIVGAAETVIQVVNLSQLYVAKAIKFCKQFNSFTSLPQMDQMILLKASFPEVASVYISFLYNIERDGFPALMNESSQNAIFVKIDFSSQMQRKDLSAIFRKFVHSMHVELEEDTALRDLIIAQLLFKPRDHLSCPEFIRYNNHVYNLLLKKYLDHKYKNPVKAKRKYENVLSMIDKIGIVSETMRQVFISEVDRSQLAEVLSELFCWNKNNYHSNNI